MPIKRVRPSVWRNFHRKRATGQKVIHTFADWRQDLLVSDAARTEAGSGTALLAVSIRVSRPKFSLQLSDRPQYDRCTATRESMHREMAQIAHKLSAVTATAPLQRPCLEESQRTSSGARKHCGGSFGRAFRKLREMLNNVH